MDSSTLSAISNVSSNLVSNAIGAYSTGEANKMARKMQNSYFNFQREQIDKANQWNLEQWNRQNEYNSTKSQVQRYKDAGINPYIALSGSAGSSSAGNASLVPPSSASSGSTSPDFKTFQPDFSSIGNIPMQLSQIQNIDASTSQHIADAKKTEELTNSLKIDNKYRDELQSATVRGLLSDVSFKEQTQEVRQLMLDSQFKQLQGDLVIQNLDIEAKTIANKYLDAHELNQLATEVANITEINSRTDLNKADTKQAYSNIVRNTAESIKTMCEAKGIKIQNSIAERCADSIVKTSINNSAQQYYNALNAKGTSDSYIRYTNNLHDTEATKKALEGTPLDYRFNRYLYGISAFTGPIANNLKNFNPLFSLFGK